MPPFLASIDDGALWLAAVVAGLTASGWLLRKAWRGYRKFDAFLMKADALIEIANYELQHNGGGSIKDSVSKIAGIESDVTALKEGDRVLREGAVLIAEQAAEMRQAIADHVDQAASIHEEQGAAIAHLAEALPIIARSTPHVDDAAEHQEEPHGHP